jgi:hypothetical protein
MRTLDFVVDRQRLKKKEDCDFSMIVAGSQGYLKATFEFTEEWAGCAKAASFYDIYGVEYAVRLNPDNSCVIPAEVLTGEKFTVSVTGVRNDYLIPSTKITVKQEVR